MKVPPQNIEAEQALIGAMFMNPGIALQLQSLLDSSDFYKEAHQQLIEAFYDLKSKADPVTVTGWLAEHGRKVPDGYIASLVDCTFTSAGWRHWADIVKSLSERRRLIFACQQAMDRAHNLTEDIQSTLSHHKAAIRHIGSDKGTLFPSNTEILQRIFSDLEDRMRSGEHLVGVPTGFENIDQHCQGLEPKTTTYLIARPSMGKTALALNISENVGDQNQGKVLFFSLESGEDALTRRRLAMRSTVYLSRIRTGDIENSQWPTLVEAANKISESNLIIFNSPKFKSIEILTATAESLAIDSPISLVVVDHIQRMRTKRKEQSRHHELSYISEELTTLAHNLNVPMLILCQLRRNVDQRRNQRPVLSDMKESGDLEQNADQVWGLYRKDPHAEIAELECLKGRDTGTWRAWLKFDRFTQKFYDSDEPYSTTDEEEFEL